MFQPNQLVAVLTQRLEYSPWIGQIHEVCVEDDSCYLKIVWLEGSYKSKWRPSKVKQGRKLVDLEDTINAETIILSRFTLGKDNKLAKDTVKLIKES